ncbi:hypothetical protein LQ327_09375 [Actinomycetospora endophytica]|uniref:Uncharacterized protein n=1 Tax=Actinomycetospora endophytica TaxID=2291215 RepID=A0ABS8P5Q0_9PSEU|nr:hypothetical protein [Actinomycetospora endophytica]MCD2193590.1 hypothetical protein [Actinomycetospora endophytica]
MTDPLAGVRAARLARDVAAGQLREQALHARGAGHSWDDIADALELTDTSDDSERCGQQLGELAWEWLIEHRPPAPGGRRGMPGSAVWVCTACRARVRDTGPYACHPDDRESGHASGCPRHRAALAAYRDELTDHDDDHDACDASDEAGDDPARGAALAPPIEDTTGHQKGTG